MPIFRSIRRLGSPLLAAILLSGVAACGTSISQTQVHGYMIDDATLDQVPVGSSQEQVLVVLGTPSTTATINGDVYYYISSTTKRPVAFMQPQITDQKVLAVYFDKNKKVERIANYGLKDGKVFDFIGRKTPTSGVEQSFLARALGALAF
jgi:outer membrane protein assembly factor BamE (lipoprotein component of BamABCDE complex)